MKIKVIYFLLFTSTTTLLNAQVGINTENPDQSSVLDVAGDSKGVLIPRVSEVNLITSPAKGLLVYDTKKECLSQNIGDASEPNWVCLSANVVKFFYMPSIVIDTSVTQTTEKNLYELYKKQFSEPKVRSFVNGNEGELAPSIPYFVKPDDLYYYVTAYDENVFQNITIDSQGIMTYDVNVGATNSSYMNIVFVVK